jgi:glucokinase
MALLGVDLGGTKLALAVFSDEGKMLFRKVSALGSRYGKEVGKLVAESIRSIINEGESSGSNVRSVGISVPGISHISAGTVWAPNIHGWEDYHLLAEAEAVCGDIPVTIDSDRACYILGESWKGNAMGCRDAIFLSIGTGIGAGILINGEILRGSRDIAGCIGWMALQKPFNEKYAPCGCFEYYASGEGIARLTKKLLAEQGEYAGELRSIDIDKLAASDVFSAYNRGDNLAEGVLNTCIKFWGMAIANLVSLFNPEKIILGGGVFGPAVKFIPAISEEAARWAQPVGMQNVKIDASGLEGDAGVYGAAFLALKRLAELKRI